MHFAVVADKPDLSSTERGLEKEKYNFYCVVNKLVYVTPTVRDNCAHSHLIFDHSAFLYFTRVSEGYFLCRVIRRIRRNYKWSGVVRLCYSIFLEVVGLHDFRW